MTNRSQIVITKVQDKTILVSVHNDKLYDVLVENEEKDVYKRQVWMLFPLKALSVCTVPNTAYCAVYQLRFQQPLLLP